MITALSRADDPETSHEAAASIADMPELEAIVLEALKSSAVGMILDEIIDATGMQKVTVSPRLRPLEKKRLVVRQGKRPGKSNRKQTVWLAA
jgi:DNA-binding transcriptional regulator GbsR (MarR family)